MIIGLTAFLAFLAGGIVGYMQAMSDAQAEDLNRRAHANGVTPQRSAWGRKEVVEDIAEWKAGGKL